MGLCEHVTEKAGQYPSPQSTLPNEINLNFNPNQSPSFPALLFSSFLTSALLCVGLTLKELILWNGKDAYTFSQYLLPDNSSKSLEDSSYRPDLCQVTLPT